MSKSSSRRTVSSSQQAKHLCYNIITQKSETIKYFCLVFDSKVECKALIHQLKSICNKAINIMQSVSWTESGAEQNILMMSYRSLIRSKIDFECIVYNSASTKELESLESISNEVMRKFSGCFKSTPISSLQVTTEELPLQIRRDKLSLKYFYKVKSLLQNQAFKIITPEQKTLCANKNPPPPRSQSDSKKYT